MTITRETITETSRSHDWDKERRKKRRRRLDSVDAGLVLVAAVLLGVGSHLFTDSLFRSRSDTVTTVVSDALPSTTLAAIGGPIDLALTPGIDGVVTDRRMMTVTGTATPGAIVSIGGLRSTSRSDGSWAITVLLKPGVNELAVDANGVDGEGSSTERNFTITYQPSSTTSVPAAPTIGPTPTTVATTAAATTVATTAAPATTLAAPSTTRPKPNTTTPTTTPTTSPTTTEPAPVDTEPTP